MNKYMGYMVKPYSNYWFLQYTVKHLLYRHQKNTDILGVPVFYFCTKFAIAPILTQLHFS